MPKYLYLLAFSVVNPNGAYHELKVKVNHDGLTVQARRGYVALKIRIKKLDFPRTLREGNRVANLGKVPITPKSNG